MSAGRTLQDELSAPALLTLAEVARELRVSPRQVRRLLASGRMYPADVTLGSVRGRRWRRDRLQAWVIAGCPHAAAWNDRTDRGRGELSAPAKCNRPGRGRCDRARRV